MLSKYSRLYDCFLLYCLCVFVTSVKINFQNKPLYDEHYGAFK